MKQVINLVAPVGLGGPGLSSPSVWGILSMASGAASAYHGYKRNESIPWAIAWGLLGSLFPIITPVIGVAQGFGQRAK